MQLPGISLEQNLERGQKPTARVDTPLPEEKNQDLWKAVQGFESLFMGHLISSMQATLPEGAVSGGGMPGMMFNQVMGEAMAEGGGIGLAEMLYRELQSSVPASSDEDKGGISLKMLVLPDERNLNYEK